MNTKLIKSTQSDGSGTDTIKIKSILLAGMGPKLIKSIQVDGSGMDTDQIYSTCWHGFKTNQIYPNG